MAPRLLDDLSDMDAEARRELAAILRTVSETFAEVPDGQKASFVLGLLARLFDRHDPWALS
jgi:hypothetical protein